VLPPLLAEQVADSEQLAAHRKLVGRVDAVDRNRFEGLGRRPEVTKDRTPPTEAEMVLLLDACSVLGGYAPVMRAHLVFNSYTLLRPCESRALDWSGIDLDAGETGRALIPETKSNRPKTVTLIPQARAALEELLGLPGYYPAGPVFRNKTGGPLTAPTMSAYWKEVRARAGVDVEFYVATKHYGVWFLKGSTTARSARRPGGPKRPSTTWSRPTGTVPTSAVLTTSTPISRASVMQAARKPAHRAGLNRYRPSRPCAHHHRQAAARRQRGHLAD
jgi:hypothetical protein